MFLAWSFLPVNVILAVFQFLLVRTVGSILAVYSRFGGPYANSIRWVRQGGYLEMYTTLVNSREIISNKTKLILLITIFSSFAASIADVGAVYFIHPSLRLRYSSFQLVESNQFIPFGFQRALTGWGSFVRNGANITNAMALIMNDTNHIPDAVAGRIYTARTSEYQVGCELMNFYAMNDTGDKYFIDQGGCATVTFNVLNNFLDSYDKATIKDMPNNRRSIKIPGSYGGPEMVESIPTVTFAYANTSCSLVDTNDAGLIPYIDGLTSPPRTSATSCMLPGGGLLASSLTTIKFFVSEVRNFRHITSPMFKVDTELVQAMATLAAKATNKTCLFSELRYSNTSIEVLECLSTTYGNATVSLTCSYSSANVIFVSQLEVDPAILAARGGSLLTRNGDPNTVMVVSHIPTVTDTGVQQLSIPEAKNASLAAVEYIAKLGANVYMNWDASKFYVIYDTFDTELGLEIPRVLSGIVLATMVFCAGFCLLTQYFLDPIYTGSLYKVMSIQMAPKSNSFAAMIRWSTTYSNGFDEINNTPGFYEINLKSDASCGEYFKQVSPNY
ncbi:hypothetical protein BGZ49_003967 [Haplosporangium sp. Z 27]|nr:hypothetical protein BGZ49_003967 [Haplosporangium sp. Z 27]